MGSRVKFGAAGAIGLSTLAVAGLLAPQESGAGGGGRDQAAPAPGVQLLIGHSLGGFVVQKYLESHDAPGAVLLASIPPSGVTGFLLRAYMRHPWYTTRAIATTKSLCGIGGTPELAREAFSPN